MAPKQARLRPAAAKAFLRRPAGRHERAVPPAPVAGRLLRDLQFGELQRLDFVVLRNAKYYGRLVDVGGCVQGVRVTGSQLYLDLKVTGTKDDSVLRAMSGKASRMMEVHICDSPCSTPVDGEFLVHGETFEVVDRSEEAWYTNLEAVIPEAEERDELEKLRAAARGVEEAPKPPEEKEAKTKKKKKDKKKKKEKKDSDVKKRREASPSKKEKKAEVEAKRRKAEDASSSSSSEVSDEKVGEKSLQAVFEGTGLDPDYRKRMKFLRRARKVGKKTKKKKKKKGSQGSDSSQSSSSSSGKSDEDHRGLFEPERKIKAIWRKCPGALTAYSL